MLLLEIAIHQQQHLHLQQELYTLPYNTTSTQSPFYFHNQTTYTMDFVKNAMGGNKDSSSKSSGGNQDMDYVDKGTIHFPSDPP